MYIPLDALNEGYCEFANILGHCQFSTVWTIRVCIVLIVTSVVHQSVQIHCGLRWLHLSEIRSPVSAALVIAVRRSLHLRLKWETPYSYSLLPFAPGAPDSGSRPASVLASNIASIETLRLRLPAVQL